MTLFPYFGSKRRAAAEVWGLLGADVPCYVEPFAGSLAVLLNRPAPEQARCEVVVDLDGLLVNFWRAIRDKPTDVMSYVVGPVAEAEIDAWHGDLIFERDGLTAALRDDPKLSDPQLAAWWWMGISSWLGSGFGFRRARQRPHIDRTLKGAYAQALTDERITHVAARLSNVIILAGDWSDAWTRALTPAIIKRFDRVGVFLDPPYQHDVEGRQDGLYASDDSLSAQVESWALDQPDHVRTVVAGYRNEYPRLAEAQWRVVDWRAPNGYAATDNDRRQRDVLFASPSCQHETLFA